MKQVLIVVSGLFLSSGVVYAASSSVSEPVGLAVSSNPAQPEQLSTSGSDSGSESSDQEENHRRVQCWKSEHGRKNGQCDTETGVSGRSRQIQNTTAKAVYGRSRSVSSGPLLHNSLSAPMLGVRSRPNPPQIERRTRPIMRISPSVQSPDHLENPCSSDAGRAVPSISDEVFDMIHELTRQSQELTSSQKPSKQTESHSLPALKSHSCSADSPSDLLPNIDSAHSPLAARRSVPTVPPGPSPSMNQPNGRPASAVANKQVSEHASPLTEWLAKFFIACSMVFTLSIVVYLLVEKIQKRARAEAYGMSLRFIPYPYVVR